MAFLAEKFNNDGPTEGCAICWQVNTRVFDLTHPVFSHTLLGVVRQSHCVAGIRFAALVSNTWEIRTGTDSCRVELARKRRSANRVNWPTITPWLVRF